MKTPKIAFLGIIVFALSLPAVAWSFSSKGAREEVVWVVRPDGAQSCGAKKGQSIDDVAGDLKKAGVTVLESRKGSDGKMHAMACGLPAGSVNAFLIPQADLPKAMTLGFSSAPQGFSGK